MESDRIIKTLQGGKLVSAIGRKGIWPSSDGKSRLGFKVEISVDDSKESSS
jgi:hypothetical protein